MTVAVETDSMEAFSKAAQAIRLNCAGKLIGSATRWSLAPALIPLPYLDMVFLAGIQTKLVMDLADLYGQQASKEVVSGAISVLLGTLLPMGAVHATVKLFPGIGIIVGSASMAAFGASATYAVGKVFVRHFEYGGNLANLGVAKLQADLKNEFVKAASKH